MARHPAARSRRESLSLAPPETPSRPPTPFPCTPASAHSWSRPGRPAGGGEACACACVRGWGLCGGGMQRLPTASGSPAQRLCPHCPHVPSPPCLSPARRTWSCPQQAWGGGLWPWPRQQGPRRCGSATPGTRTRKSPWQPAPQPCFRGGPGGRSGEGRGGGGGRVSGRWWGAAATPARPPSAKRGAHPLHQPPGQAQGAKVVGLALEEVLEGVDRAQHEHWREGSARRWGWRGGWRSAPPPSQRARRPAAIGCLTHSHL